MLVAGFLNVARQPGTRADFSVVGCGGYIARKLLSFSRQKKSGRLLIDLSMSEKRATHTCDYCAQTFPGDRSADPDRTRASLILKRPSLCIFFCCSSSPPRNWWLNRQ